MSRHDDDIPLLFAMILKSRFDRSTAYLLDNDPVGISLSVSENLTNHEEANRARYIKETKAVISGYCREAAEQFNTIYGTDILYPMFEFTREDYGHFYAKKCLFLLTPETSDAEDEEEEDEEVEGGDDSNSEPAATSSMKNETPDRPRPRVKYFN